jgi:hypothetical protein
LIEHTALKAKQLFPARPPNGVQFHFAKSRHVTFKSDGFQVIANIAFRHTVADEFSKSRG